MNILLTEHCSKNCDFCLISARSVAPRHMSAESFETCLDFADASEQQLLTLLGGEPTSNPQFEQLLERAIARGFRIVLLSNFLFDASTSKKVHRWAREGAIREFLVNADFPSAYTEAQWRRFRANLAGASASAIRVTLAITLRGVRPIGDYAYLRDHYDEFDASRIRVALDVRALASVIGRAEVGEHYYRVVRYLAEHGFAVGAELCAVARCIFTEYQHDYLRCHCAGYSNAGSAGCEPNLDVFPDLRIAYCAGRPATPVFRRSLAEFATLDHARAYFRGLRDLLHTPDDETDTGLPACRACSASLRDECRFGCLSPFDELAAKGDAAAAPHERSPVDVRVIPLLDRWHVWVGGGRGIGDDSFVVDNVGMRILGHAWAGGRPDEIADDIAEHFDVVPDRARADVVALLDAARIRGALNSGESQISGMTYAARA